MEEIALPRLDVVVPVEGLTIGEVARATGLPVSTLRFYERRGLMLDPTPRDPGNRRRYDESDLAWIGGLLMLRATGMPVSAMRELAELSRRAGTEGDRLRILQAHRELVLARWEETRRHLAALDRKIDAYRRAIAGGEPSARTEGRHG